MDIEFAGGARTVTGSSFILKDDDFNIMIDCGMFQGKQAVRDRNYLRMIHDPSHLNALLLTHAHIDHCGLIPKLIKDGFFGNIYTTKATADLCSIMLPDSAHIQEMDTEWINKKNKRLGRDPVYPLYSSHDATSSMKNFVPVDYDEMIQIHPRIQVRFRDAGHILGSSIIEIWVDYYDKQTKLVFSGDLGKKNQAIIRDPDLIEEADFLFIESTYGNRLHKGNEDTYEEFKNIIINTLDQNGNIIIPAFAVERTQEIIFTLAKLIQDGDIPEMPVYIDSPLAISATEIFKENEQYFDEETRDILLSGQSPLDFPSLHFSKTLEESKKLNDDAKGTIIISASGMCTAGRIKYHLMNNLYKPESSVIFVGYQAEGTIGRRLVDGATRVRLYGEDVVVRAKIHTLGGFSAHADRDGLLEWMEYIKNPKLKVFVIHGEEESSESFAEDIRSKFGYETYVPNWGEIVNLDTMRSSIADYGISDSYTTVDREIEALSESFRSLTEKYHKTRDMMTTQEVKRLQEEINDAREMLSLIIDAM